MPIESYSFGNIVIDGEKYTNDVIVFPNGVKDNWWRKEGHSLHPEDIEDVVDRDPDVLIVGTGAYGKVSIPSDTREYIESRGIELVAEKTREAVETLRDIKDEEKAVAALHLTC
ncbi:hypothetical protein AKJ64_03175 [candidate division MSBL1 archaeon SCGC-AAA259E17]|uniref:Uncharacterized protein n=1 Tax=candidate division MSBL1 archaeon SCGC-AAA259E17 TaxID=1698263 RepID=A0A133UE07_9EURY|nr:hypothetical protein AKJ64_03175 [candidate division MSBL1 archaeon SCGC-AAA259E17]